LYGNYEYDIGFKNKVHLVSLRLCFLLKVSLFFSEQVEFILSITNLIIESLNLLFVNTDIFSQDVNLVFINFLSIVSLIKFGLLLAEFGGKSLNLILKFSVTIDNLGGLVIELLE
jgi:hypothetical protein